MRAARRISLVLYVTCIFSCRHAPISEGELSTAEFRALMLSLASAWSNQDTDAAIACFLDDAIYMQPPDQQLYRGHQELRRLFDALEVDTSMTFHHVAFDEGNQVGFGEFSFGRLGSDAADHGVVIIDVKDRRIASWREYFVHGPFEFSEFIAAEGKDWSWTVEQLE